MGKGGFNTGLSGQKRERIFMEDEAIIALYWQRSEEAIVQTQKKYGPYCHWALF